MYTRNQLIMDAGQHDPIITPKKAVGNRCCVQECVNYYGKTTGEGISYMSLPKEDKWKQQLLVRIRLADVQEIDRRKICTAHFEPKCLLFHGKKHLLSIIRSLHVQINAVFVIYYCHQMFTSQL